MNGRNHLTLTSIVDALVFAAAIGGLAIVVSVGFISQHAGGPARIAASSANRIDGHAVTLTRSQERTAPTSSATPAWRVRYAALKDRQTTVLDSAARPPCRAAVSARERYDAFKLHQGDDGIGRIRTQGCQ